LHWRTVSRRLLTAINAQTGHGDGELRNYYYSAAWQLLEERIDDDYTQEPGFNRIEKEVWGLRYIDDPVMRWNTVVIPPPTENVAFIYDEGQASKDITDYDASAAAISTSPPPPTRFYHLTDVQFSTLAMIGTGSSPKLYERVRYDAYGQATHRWPA